MRTEKNVLFRVSSDIEQEFKFQITLQLTTQSSLHV